MQDLLEQMFDDEAQTEAAASVVEHLDDCAGCHATWTANVEIRQRLKDFRATVQTPDTLRAKIRGLLESQKKEPPAAVSKSRTRVKSLDGVAALDRKRDKRQPSQEPPQPAPDRDEDAGGGESLDADMDFEPEADFALEDDLSSAAPDKFAEEATKGLAENDPIRLYLREIGSIPLLKPDQEIELARLIEVGGAEGAVAKRQLVQANLRLVVS
ncbi:MAG: sigma-70 factor domain-containing protein, partial [Terriglobales bacterium]